MCVRIRDSFELEEQSIKFVVSGYKNPVLELKENGDILVKGKAVVNDMEVYLALKEFIIKTKEAKIMKFKTKQEIEETRFKNATIPEQCIETDTDTERLTVQINEIARSIAHELAMYGYVLLKTDSNLARTKVCGIVNPEEYADDYMMNVCKLGRRD